MKTILWVCNTPLPEVQNMIGVRNYNEGWLTGISNQLRKREDINFHYAFPQNRYKRTLKREVDRITFWGFYNFHKKPFVCEQESVKALKEIIRNVKPDMVHIFGTEFPHCLECIYSVPDKNKIVVSIQGLTSEIAKVYLRGIPFFDRLRGQFDQCRYRCLFVEQMEFYRRGKNEKKALKEIKHVIGRTSWDKNCVKKINAQCKYYHCNETLRDVFYDGTWNIKNIRRHSIFISQANYSIKGLHMLISILPFIKRKYPDVMVRIAGNTDFLTGNTPYGNYIKREMKKYNVEKSIQFLGFLSDVNMKKALLESHVMLMPSLIENSPNSVGEAMLLGTPVVASDAGGTASILKDKREGYLYPSTDKSKMAKRIIRIFSDDRLAEKFSRNGKKRAGEIYDQSGNLQQLLKIYNAVYEKTVKNFGA